MIKLQSGKVRDIYQVSETELVIVTTDRISAFDVVLPTAIENKGIALNLLSLYWFERTKNIISNHILSADLADMPAFFARRPEQFKNRTVLVKKLDMLPYEFIVRGYMFGSLWTEYQNTGRICGQSKEKPIKLAQRLEQPVITPSVKNDTGHDENITLERLRDELGSEDADAICDICMRLYQACYEHALKRGILIADTKFEFGRDKDGRFVLGDEICTPDSSRFWAAEDWQEGTSPRSYDKQFVRDWLIRNGLNGVKPAPELPREVVEITSALYQTCCQKLTGRE